MKFPHVDTLHFYSDGPCTQYRQKHNFYLFKKFVHELGFKFASWNFFEAGHGKGAPDGIGGSVKRSADLRVKYGNDVCSASQFVSQLEKADTSAPVSNADIIPPVEEPLPQLPQTHLSIDASIALQRLESCNSFALLHHECEAQKPYVPLIQGRKRALISDKIMIDTFATGLIPKDLNSSQRLFAGKVRADGDCLPGSGSVFAFGTDQQSDLLRLKIIHELVLNSDFYTSEKNMLKGFVKKLLKMNLSKLMPCILINSFLGHPSVLDIYMIKRC